MNTTDDTQLSVSGVTLQFGGVAALSDVNFSADRGETVGIIGTNGSGKTSLLNCVSGVYRPDAGTITLDGQRIDRSRAHKLASQGVARTFQNPEAPPELTVTDFTMLGRHTAMGGFGLVAYGLGIPYFSGHEARHRSYALAALARVEMTDLAETPMADLSYGLAKRADLARALASGPKLLLLDEPAAGLNEQERAQLAELLADLVSDEITVLLVEHDMSFVSRVCPRVMVLVDGNLLYDGPTAPAMCDPRVVQSFLGGVLEEEAPS